MPLLDDPRREHYAQLLVKGVHKAEAYTQAGYHCTTAHSLDVASSARANEPDIAARVAELRARAAKRAELKADDIIDMLRDDRKLARELGQPSAAIRAAELLGKQIGMFTDKKEVRVGALDDLSTDQLDAIIFWGESRESDEDQSGDADGASAAGPAGEAEGGGGGSQAHLENPHLLSRSRAAAPGAIP